MEAKDIKQKVIEQPIDPIILDSLFKDALGLKLTEGKTNPNKIEETLELGDVSKYNFREPTSVLQRAQATIDFQLERLDLVS